MTNKLPVVGKKYRHKTLGNVVEFVGDREDGYFIAAEKTLKHYAGNYFLANYEELPDSNPQEVNEVDRALEELKENIYVNDTKWANNTSERLRQLYSVVDAAQNLVNALEAEKNLRAIETNEIAASQVKNDEKQAIFARRCESKVEPSIPKNMSKPEPNLGYVFEIKFLQDGDKICATLPDFKNLQESPAGFGDDKEEALVGLIYSIFTIKTETKLETQSHISELSSEMKEAMEEFRNELTRIRKGERNTEIQISLSLAALMTHGENIINILDKQFKANEIDRALEAENDMSKPELAIDENEKAYYEAISKYPKGIKAHSFYPYEPCECCSDPKAYAEYMSKSEPKIDMKEESVKEIKQNNKIEPYKRSSLICATCGHIQESVYPAFTQIKTIQCGKCLKSGFMHLNDNFTPVEKSYFSNEEKEIRCCDCCGAKLGTIACASSFKLGLFCSAKCADTKEERVEPVSIWKDVGELPTRLEQLLIKFHDGDALLGKYNPHDDLKEEGWQGCWYNISKAKETALKSFEIKQWATLADFINSFEQMQKDIEELKRK